MPSPGKRTRYTNPAEKISRKIESRTAHLGVIGLGYVGLPLAVEFAQAGFKVTGIDIDEARVGQIQRGRSIHYNASAALTSVSPATRGRLRHIPARAGFPRGLRRANVLWDKFTIFKKGLVRLFRR